MATALVDSAPEVQDGGTQPGSPAGDPAPPAPQPVQAPRTCPACSAPMAPGQDWCLQCGAPPPAASSSGWRPAAIVLAATALLVLGAGAAAYAALTHKARHAPVVTATVAQPAPTTPAPVTPAPTTTPAPAVTPPAASTTPPSTPTKTPTPEPAATTPAASTPTTPATTTPTTPASTTPAPKAEPLLLDTNAASTYNPYEAPGTFGDPSLAIDGDTSTGWTAQVDPATAPKMAVGLLLDLRNPQHLANLTLVTTTPGMAVQIYGSNAKTAPASITDSAWVPLSHLMTLKKRHVRAGLKNQKKSYRFIVVWISKAPPSSTPQAPGRVTLNEAELFPPA